MDIQLAALNAVRHENGVHAAKNHYQDAHAMSVYLTLNQDDEHYIYKYRAPTRASRHALALKHRRTSTRK